MATRKRGRPPAGPKGAKISAYKGLTLRLPDDERAQLRALAFVRERSASEIVSEAIRHYLKSVPARERRLVAALAKKKG